LFCEAGDLFALTTKIGAKPSVVGLLRKQRQSVDKRNPIATVAISVIDVAKETAEAHQLQQSQNWLTIGASIRNLAAKRQKLR